MNMIRTALLFSALLPLLPAQDAPEAKADAPAEPSLPKVTTLRPAGLYQDLAEAGFDLTSALMGGGSVQPKPFYEFLELLTETARKHTAETPMLLDLTGSPLMNPAQLREVERTLAAIRKDGKKLVAYVENAGPVEYQLAVQCDRILLADMGGVDLRSPALNTMHFRDAMDLLGIQAEVIRVGDFKGAVEPYMLSEMSSHLRKHYEAMLASINEDFVRRIADGRKKDGAEVRRLQGLRIFTAKEALELGLVDRIVPYAGAQRAMATELGQPAVELVEAGKKARSKNRDLMTIFTEMMRGKGGKDEEIESPQLVVVHLSGAIEDGGKASPGAIVSGPTVEMLDKLAENNEVKGVVVRINSPGGSATASENIRLALERLAAKKPLVFSMGELAASGGYWITMIDRPILAESATITGSIGVFGMILKAGPLMRRLGIKNEVVALDEGPTMEALDRPMPETLKLRMQQMTDSIYAMFVEKAAASRKMSVEALNAVAGGRVWSGKQALERGLVDSLGGLDEALAMVRTQAGVDDKVEVNHLPKARSFADSLFDSFGGDASVQSALQPGLTTIAARMLRLDGIVVLLRDALAPQARPKVWALMPATVRVQ